MAELETKHNPDEHRWEAWLDGELAGVAEYQLTDQLYVFTHTEVPRRFEGHGVGSALARAAVEGVRADGERRVLAICPFIKGWIDRHPDHRDLLYGAPRSTATD